MPRPLPILIHRKEIAPSNRAELPTPASREVVDVMNKYDIGTSAVGRIYPAQRRSEINIEAGRGPLLVN